jgi:anti-anti-sigma factor
MFRIVGVPSALRVTAHETFDGWLVCVAGELDRRSGQELSALLALLVDQGEGDVLLDFHQVERIADNRGVQLIEQAQQRLEAGGRRLRLTGLNDRCRNRMHITGFDQLLAS